MIASTEQLLSVTGVIETVVYSNEETQYAVVRVTLEESCRQFVDPRMYSGRSGSITAAGEGLASIPLGETVNLNGVATRHKTFGMQLKVESMEVIRPRSVHEIEVYLATHIKQINKTLARRITDKFGDQTLEVIDKEPHRLLEIYGIAETRLEEVKIAWEESAADREVLQWFTKHGLPVRFKAAIQKRYGPEALGLIQQDPYRLAYDIKGIGFKTADGVAMRMGVAGNSPIRLRALAHFQLSEERDSGGHCYMNLPDLVTKVTKEAGVFVTREAVEAAIAEAGKAKILSLDDAPMVYLPDVRISEIAAAQKIRAIMDSPVNERLITRHQEIVRVAVEAAGVELHPLQHDAVVKCLTSRVSILMGGPGTGKTLTTRAVVAGFNEAGLPVTLLAPTGRAANRMSEAIGMSASTVHRFLYMLIKDPSPPEINGVILLDEVSMLDLSTFSWLLKYVSPHATLVFVGDPDQLPAVGAGAVLRDLIRCGAVPLTKLEHIFRQGEASDIAANAHAINRGTLYKVNPMSARDGVPNSDMLMCNIEDGQKQVEAIVWLATKFAPRRGYSSRDVQVLVPRYGGDVGVEVLNIALQAAINPNPSDSITRGKITWGIGDRLLNHKNNYKIDIFNGDIGHIESFRRGPDGTVDSMIVCIDNRDVEVPKEWFMNMHLAYAATVHKSQGGEFPVVIVGVHPSHGLLLKRNLVYTAVTRARKLCVLVSSPVALGSALRSVDANNRRTRLAERITS